MRICRRKSMGLCFGTPAESDFLALLPNSFFHVLGTGCAHRDQQQTSSPFLSSPLFMCMEGRGMMNFGQADVVQIAVPGPPRSIGALSSFSPRSSFRLLSTLVLLRSLCGRNGRVDFNRCPCNDTPFVRFIRTSASGQEPVYLLHFFAAKSHRSHFDHDKHAFQGIRFWPSDGRSADDAVWQSVWNSLHVVLGYHMSGYYIPGLNHTLRGKVPRSGYEFPVGV